jgi:predicted  nucleic acid-binding Zn-ribbon protein
MSYDPDGWREVGVVTDAVEPDFEEGYQLGKELDDSHRVVDIHEGEVRLERPVEADGRWVRIAEITIENPGSYQEHLHEAIESEEYRVVSVADGGFYVEKHVTDD